MSRATWNAIVDAICFAALLGVPSTGVAVRGLLPPGSGPHSSLEESTRSLPYCPCPIR